MSSNTRPVAWNNIFFAIVRVATFIREIGPSDSKIHMLMSEVVNKLIVEGFVKKMSTSCQC